MRILHTADWHLGKRLDNFSRMEEQVLVMNEIVEIADREQVDIVLVAGDLFDAFNPSTEAIELFYKTLKRLSRNGHRPVIAIAGNHDSPALIDAPDPLARECGIILIGHPNALVHPIALADFDIINSVDGMIELRLKQFAYPIRILHTAYANEIRLKQYLGENKEDALNEILAHHWQSLADKYCDNNGVNLLMAHLYMNKRGTPPIEEPEGEKPIKIGNADMVYSEAIPPQIQYTALGHIHRFQNIGSPTQPVVYSSSPLCYSFSEAGQTKYVSIIEAEPNKEVLFHKIALINGKQLARKNFHSTQDALAWLSTNPDTLVELTLESDTFLKAEDRKALYQTHSGIIHLIPKVKNDTITSSDSKSIDLNKDIDDLFHDYFKSKHKNQEPSEELMQLFNEILKS